MNIENIESTLVIKTDRADQEIQTFARDTGKALDKATTVELEINVGKLQSQLTDARANLKKFKLEGDKAATLDAQINVNRLAGNLTEAKRQLNNYRNTGDKTLSRLQSKFD